MERELFAGRCWSSKTKPTHIFRDQIPQVDNVESVAIEPALKS
jgi:hypothetical protein